VLGTQLSRNELIVDNQQEHSAANIKPKKCKTYKSAWEAMLAEIGRNVEDPHCCHTWVDLFGPDWSRRGGNVG